MKTISCSAISNPWLKPQLRDRGISRWGTRKLALTVRDVLNYLFPGRWFGRGWSTSLAPLTWPQHGPDLTIPDNSLWGSINRRVSVPRCNTNKECHRAAKVIFRTNAPTHVTEDMEAYPLLCPASGCKYGSTGHVTNK